MRSAADSTAFSVVDVYNSITGAWSTTNLSVACYFPAAASVANVVLFAGVVHQVRCFAWIGILIVYGCVRVVLGVCVCCSVAVMFALRSLALSCAPLQVF